MSSYVAVAYALLEALDQDSKSALAGGVAVAAHGFVRGTKDVDIVVGIPLLDAQARLGTHGIASTLKRGDPLEGDFSCLKGELNGIPFDVIPQLVPVDWERSVAVSVAGKTVRVVDLGSLLALKLRAGGPRDILDVAMLALIHPEQRESALQLARRYGRADTLARHLDDSRLQAEAEAARLTPTNSLSSTPADADETEQP